MEFPFQKMEVYAVARDLARRVHGAGVRDPDLCDRAIRSARSTFLRLCEGLPADSPTVRRRSFVEAYHHLHETVGAMDLAHTVGVVGDEEASAVRAMSWRLRWLLLGLIG